MAWALGGDVDIMGRLFMNHVCVFFPFPIDDFDKNLQGQNLQL